ncbi:MAG: type I restriction-modification system subunit M [Candidatus Brocadiales bacterium]|nr:type I restriction-modification system subunit M [Candidatus Brocadiales bacterium]
MTREETKQEIFQVVWSACDTFRGVIDPSQYKDYILTMLFVKYLSDIRKSKLDEFNKKYGDNKLRVDRAMSRERFSIAEDCTFDFLYSHRNGSDIGQVINTVLEKIEDANKSKLHNVFRNIDFNSESNLGQTRQRNQRLKTLLEDFANPGLDLRPENVKDMDIVGDVYEFLIGRFAAQAGKKAGEFYTPAEVSETLAQLVAPKAGDRICDPTCGSGSLLIRASKQIDSNNFSLFGQEMNGSTWALCKMNMFLHEVDSARIEWEDTIRHPQLVEDDKLTKFDIVIANPPFSLDKWGQEIAADDQYGRFTRGIPPKSKGDWAFISHMISTAIEGKGRVGVVVPHGVLFRGGQEGKIRQSIIEENILAGVVGLPSNLFYGAGIPAALMIFDKSRVPRGKGDVFFIDASSEFLQGTNQNRLGEQHIAKIVQTFHSREVIDKYSYISAFSEIKDNEFNLNIPRYVDTFEPEPEVDVDKVQGEINGIEEKLKHTRKLIDAHLNDLGFR